MQTIDSYPIGITMHKRRRSFIQRPVRFFTIVAVLVIVVIAAALLLFPSGRVIPLSSSTTLLLKQNQSVYFKIFNSTNVGVLYLQRLQNASSIFYVSSLPILSGPISAVQILAGSGVNVSTEGSAPANLNIALLASNSSGARVKLTPITSSLNIRVSSSVTLISLPPLGFGTGTSNKSFGLTVTSTVATTSVATTSTILNTTAAKEQQALSIANTSGPGSLMLKYKALYEADIKCNASTYNSTYLAHYSKQPTGTFTFQNVSPATPTDITTKITQAAKADNFLVTYSTVAPSSQFTGPALLMGINVSSISPIVNATFKGLLFQGLNYTTVNSIYTTQNRIGNACAALIP